MIKTAAFLNTLYPIFNTVDMVLLICCAVYAFRAFRLRHEWSFACLGSACAISVLICLAFILEDAQSIWSIPLGLSLEFRQAMLIVRGILYPFQVVLYPIGILLLLHRYLRLVPPKLPNANRA